VTLQFHLPALPLRPKKLHFQMATRLLLQQLLVTVKMSLMQQR
jgi:hypothetical protein